MSKNYIDFVTEENRHRRLQLFTCGVNSEQQILRALAVTVWLQGTLRGLAD
jgi:hypothetical protein